MDFSKAGFARNSGCSWALLPHCWVSLREENEQNLRVPMTEKACFLDLKTYFLNAGGYKVNENLTSDLL
jgi:hypothetical protein